MVAVRVVVKGRNTYSMLACKLAATGFRGVELSEDNLSLNELAETPLDNIPLPSGIFAVYGPRESHGPFRGLRSGLCSTRSGAGERPAERNEVRKACDLVTWW